MIAEIQHITYDEFIPALMGNNALGAYTGYNPKVNPSISAEFSVAAFRIGHTLLNANVDFFNNDGSESHDPLDFSGSADSPGTLSQDGTTVDNILKYLTGDNAQEVDLHIEDSFRNFLFDPSNTAGLDLNAIDIQRGRDLGLPDYNTVRAAYGLPKVKTFSQITSDPVLQTALKNLYGNVNNIDLFVGGLAENHLSGSSVGATFTAIMVNQFSRLRAGDRLWYQRTFTGADLKAIQQTTLADVISRNTSIDNLQSRVFFFTTGTISGHATVAGWPLSQGLPSLIVKLYDSNGQFVAQTTTKSDGSYHFDNTPEGNTYSVRITTPWFLNNQSSSTQAVDLVDNSGAGQFNANFAFNLLSVFTQNPTILVYRPPVWSAPLRVYREGEAPAKLFCNR